MPTEDQIVTEGVFPVGLRAAVNRIWRIVAPLRQVIGSSPVVVEQVDGRGTVVRLDQATQDLLNQLTGRSDDEAPDDGTGTTTEWRTVILCNDGTPEEVQILTRPVP